MRSHARVWFLTVVCGVLMAALLPTVAQGAEEVPFSIGNFVATNCEEGFEKCGEGPALPGPYTAPLAEVTKEEAEEEGFTEAGGRVPFGITDFAVAAKEGSINTGNAVPSGVVTHIRTDVAPGLATNPEAIPHCTAAEFGKEALPETGLFEEPKCSVESEIGENRVLVYIAAAKADVQIPEAPETNVYNLVQPEGPKEGEASSFGVALKLEKFLTEGELKAAFEAKPLPEGEFPGEEAEKLAEKKGTEEALEKKQYWAHTLIEGNVEWGKESLGTDLGDFHDYFEIEVSPNLPLVRSRLIFKGNVGTGDFITNATSCPGHNTTTLTLTDAEGAKSRKTFTTPVGLEGCKSLKFEPSFSLTASTAASDQPDPFAAAASEPHNPKATDQSQVKSASFTLPEGMTLNPSAAAGLTACTPKQAHQEGTVFGPQFGVECPASSKIGTVSLNVPTLPNGSLKGDVYLAGEESGLVTKPPYMIYVVANSERYRVSVRLLGEVIPNETTGQVTTFFRNPPEQPFSQLALQFERGVLAPIANPLLCGTPTGSSSFEPTSEPGTARTAAFGVSITGCEATIPFALTQSTSNQTATAGGHTSFTFNLARTDGNQYLSEVKTVLPAGLIGEIPAVTLCAEQQANSETEACPANSLIGTATVTAGSGPTPYTFAGQVFMTESYKGAPYGMSIKVPATAGPFSLGTVVTRATVNVDQTTGQVIVDSLLPRIYKGIPIRTKSLSIAVTKQGFLLNPTSCGVLSTASTLTGFTALGSTAAGATQSLSTPFQVGSCSALKFKPTFKAATNAKTSRSNGASLTTTITQPNGQANIKSVKVQLPRQLPSRLTTLQKACPAATFEANPFSCPAASNVGTATIATPALPGKVTGPAYLVSHAGASFPDLDLVVESTSHVRVILVGNTDIKKGITTTTFASTPDVPISSVSVSLPTGPHSALGSFGNLCAQPLVMPTTMTGQNGGTFKQNTIISVAGCGVRIVGHKVIGNTAYITVQTYAAGRISGSGSGLKTVYRKLSRAYKTVSLIVPLSSRARGKRRPLHISLRVGFLPKAAKGAHSSAKVKVTFR
jgi:hypothetical protein